MLNKSCLKHLVLFLSVVNIYCQPPIQDQSNANVQAIAPVLDIDDEKIGYIGTIGERNVLVDLKPHLQIRNIDQINGICSYHVFKPNNEEFPFTIDIKDKTTGEAVIEVLKKELEPLAKSEDGLDDSKKEKFILLDCKKRKEFTFLIQAHDCSSPSLPSNKVSVKIEVLDHDDYRLKFESTETYKKNIVMSNTIYEKLMTIKARDNDCTNDGYACAYQLISNDEMSVVLDDKFPFKIDNNGVLSSTQALNKIETFVFKVRAIDCLNNDSYVDALVHIEVVEPCVPQWIDYSKEVMPTAETTNIFEILKVTSCEQYNHDLAINQDSACKIETINSKVKLELDTSINNACKKDENCDETKELEAVTSKVTLFSGKADSNSNEDDDNDADEDDDLNDENVSSEDENKIVKNKNTLERTEPLNFISFSKEIQNAQKIDFNGHFGDSFTLSVWLKRPANADKQIKEQVLCGTDSNNMNRHHFGLYFYRGNIKFLMRKESANANLTPVENENAPYYPSLWQWALYEPLLSDAKWHFYEIKLNYPKASLYIDGNLFAENSTNSDIIDAQELKNTNEVESLTTYIGACFHARTKSLVDHFEGHIGPLKLVKKASVKKTDPNSLLPECKMTCNEAIQINTVGNEKFISSIKNVNSNEISIQTTNLNDMNQIIGKINYINKKSNNPQVGPRKIIVNTTIQCANNGKQINLNILNVNLNVKHPKREYNIQLNGDRKISALKSQIENGIKPFSTISIEKTSINQVDEDDDDSSSNSDEDDDSVDLSRCQIHFYPELNSNKDVIEKVTYDQVLLDQFKFDFKETSDVISINGLQNIKNYEMFIRTLSYQIIDDTNTVDQTKQFELSCVRNEPNIETNTLAIQLNITKDEVKHEQIPNFVAHKQKSQLLVSESDDEILERKDYKLNNPNEMSTPLIIALIVMCSCAMGFLLIFGAIRLRSVGFLGGKKKNLINEENPQMEWDDSGLNITENPLESFEVNKKFSPNDGHLHSEAEDDEEYSSYEEEGEEDDEEDQEDDFDQYSSDEEEQEKTVARTELEWDDTSIEIKDKRLQKEKILSNKNMSNKSIPRVSSVVNDFNKFV